MTLDVNYMWSIAGLSPIKSFNCDMHFLHTSCFYAYSSSWKMSLCSAMCCVGVDWGRWSAWTPGNGSLKGVIGRRPRAERGDSARQLGYTGECTSGEDLRDVCKWLHKAHFIWEKQIIRFIPWSGRIQRSKQVRCIMLTVNLINWRDLLNTACLTLI